MQHDVDHIQSILDNCCDAFTFPMLDNGYVYLAATRLSLHRSPQDWAMVIEVFGFSLRVGLPDIAIHTFAGRLHDRDPVENYVNLSAYENYLANNPNNEVRFKWPIDDGPWIDADNEELVAADAQSLTLRGRAVPLPPIPEYARHGIELERSPRVHVFELCRFLAATARQEVLATEAERRVSIFPEMRQILQLEEWHHPDLAREERPSTSETFQQLARALVTGDARHYRSSEPPNTHWRNWPEARTM